MVVRVPRVAAKSIQNTKSVHRCAGVSVWFGSVFDMTTRGPILKSPRANWLLFYHLIPQLYKYVKMSSSTFALAQTLYSIDSGVAGRCRHGC